MINLTGKQKIFFLLNQIEDKRVIAPKGKSLFIHPLGDLNGNYTKEDLLNLLYKFQHDDDILTVDRLPRENEFGIYGYEDAYYGFKINPKFDEYFNKVKQDPDYQDFVGIKPAVTHKLNRKSLEKIWNILQEIEINRGITLKQGDVKLPQVHLSRVKDEREAKVSFDERLVILQKLELEEQAVSNVSFSNDFITFQIGDKYFEVYEKYEQEYKKVVKEFQKSKSGDEQVKTLVYEIKYSEQTREISINNFLFKKLVSFSTNDSIFAYLYSHPNQDVSLEELQNGTHLNSLDLNKFVENLGFKSDFRKIFFKVSKNKIRFNNPITTELLEATNIKTLKL